LTAAAGKEFLLRLSGNDGEITFPREEEKMGHVLKQSRRACLAILVLVVGLGYAGWAEAQQVDGAMQAFIQAMHHKTPQAVLAVFSQQTPWRYVNYEIGTGKQLSSRMVSFQQMAADFQRKTGWYNFFFAKPNGYTFMVLFFRGEPWRQSGPATFTPPDVGTAKTHITWRQEGGKWVIAEIGETTP
jgi:hypothetical protein